MFLLKGLYMHNTLCVVVVIVIVVGRICDILLYCSKPFGFHYFYDLNRRGKHHFIENYYDYYFSRKILKRKARFKYRMFSIETYRLFAKTMYLLQIRFM